jgi:lipopolysaccharide assembly outer membrane protein LptD (OstA)
VKPWRRSGEDFLKRRGGRRRLAFAKEISAMKTLVCSFAMVLGSGIAQDAGLKHLYLSTPGSSSPIAMTAQSIEREVDKPAEVHLKGSVEIKQQVCLPVGKKGALVCDGYRLLHADEASVHTDTGAIEARGSVRLSGLLHEK